MEWKLFCVKKNLTLIQTIFLVWGDPHFAWKVVNPCHFALKNLTLINLIFLLSRGKLCSRSKVLLSLQPSTRNKGHLAPKKWVGFGFFLTRNNPTFPSAWGRMTSTRSNFRNRDPDSPRSHREFVHLSRMQMKCKKIIKVLRASLFSLILPSTRISIFLIDTYYFFLDIFLLRIFIN